MNWRVKYKIKCVMKNKFKNGKMNLVNKGI